MYIVYIIYIGGGQTPTRFIFTHLLTYFRRNRYFLFCALAGHDYHGTSYQCTKYTDKIKRNTSYNSDTSNASTGDAFTKVTDSQCDLMTMRGSNIHLDNVLLCKMSQRIRFSHISNFKRLVVAVVETSTSIIFEPIFSQKIFASHILSKSMFRKIFASQI